MIETTVPEINVAELMEKVRAEATRPKPVPPRPPSSPAAPVPPVAMLPAAPSVWIPGPVKSVRERLDRIMEAARQKNDGGSRLPKFLRRFFRKQGGFNRAVLDGVASLAKNNHELTQRVADISVCLEQLNGWLLALHEQSDADSNWMKAATPAFSRIAKLEKDLELLENHLHSTHDTLHELWAERGTVAKRLSALEARTGERLATLDTGTKERIGALETGTNERIAALESRTQERSAAIEAETNERVGALHGVVEKIQQEIKESAAATTAALGQARDDWGRVEEETRSLRGDLDTASTQLRTLRLDVDNAGLHLRNLQAQTDGIDRNLAELTERSGTADSRRDQEKDDLQHQIDHAALHLRNLQVQADRLGVHINNLQNFVDKKTAEADALHHGMEQRLADHADLPRRIAAFEERTIADAALLKGELAEYGALFRQILGQHFEEPVSAGKGTVSKAPPAAKAMPGLDAFYLAFENRFRGPRDVIKKRVAFYLPFLRKCRAGIAGRPVLDVGCGRGEWLELLKEHKLEGRGVDINTVMVAQCKARGLKVDLRDAIQYLHSLRAGTQGAVTGFHIIEHLSFETLLELFRQARRVLKPGGVAIFESPNCKNLVVGACNFHIDPTHRHPVFPETAELMLSAQGFEKIRIEYLSPVPDVKFSGSTPELAAIKDLLYGPQDFGIIAYKPRR